jgi:hypothetical protein
MRIAVAGMVAGDAGQGGAAWAVLQYALGLRSLGHEVLLLEEVDDSRFAAAAARLGAIATAFRLRSGLVGRPSGRVAGVTRSALDGADLLLNLSGVLRDDDLLARPALRAYVDLDPGFTQLWHDDGVDLGLDRHDRLVTIGMRLGAHDCPVPVGDRSWVTTPQPIALEHWPLAAAPAAEALTTVGHWRSYGSLHRDGIHYGQKAHALRPLLDVPARANARFRLALAIHPDEVADRAALERHGWQLADPLAVAGTPSSYRDFVRGSWAEFGLTKLGYVASRCGWFSDRSLCYLASGRPVIAHDTGFGAWLPTGEGVIPFTTADDVAAGVEALRSSYERHRRAARALAEDVFRADRVLGRLLECL